MTSNKVTFSLILATVERTFELERFLFSLSQQNCQNFELIIVDQNEDERIVPIINRFKKAFPVTHLKTPYRGLSRARNLGLQYARGDVIAFPDDDCIYPPNLLKEVEAFCRKNPKVDFLIVKAKSLDGRDFSMQPKKAGRVSLWTMWHLSISWALFVTRPVAQQLAFDEELGVGAGTPWGSGEDIDYGLRALKAGFKAWYEPSLWVAHPNNPPLLDKARRYGRGNGYVLRKHRAWGKFAWGLIRRGIALVFYALKGELKEVAWRWEALKGTMEGFFARVKSHENSTKKPH